MNASSKYNTYQQLCKRCTISINKNAYLRLKDRGRFGESFSELVSRLLDELDDERRRSGEDKTKN